MKTKIRTTLFLTSAIAATLSAYVIISNISGAQTPDNTPIPVSNEPQAISYNATDTGKTDETEVLKAEVAEEKTVEETKREIWHKMLNSIDYYDSAKGVFYYSLLDERNCIKVSYQTNVAEAIAQSHILGISVSDIDETFDNNQVDFKESGHYQRDIYCGEKGFVCIDEINKTYNGSFLSIQKRRIKNWLPDEVRYSVDSDGIPHYEFHSDVTNTYMGSFSLLPQEFCFGFLNDFDMWEIDETVEYAGRNCYSISGKANESYGASLEVDSFTMLVDEETGCLLRLKGLDETGKISKFLITESIEFDCGIDSFDTPDSEGYKIVDY